MCIINNYDTIAIFLKKSMEEIYNSLSTLIEKMQVNEVLPVLNFLTTEFSFIFYRLLNLF